MTIVEMFKADLKKTEDLNKLKIEISRFDDRPNRVLGTNGEKKYTVSRKDYEYFSRLIEEEERSRQQEEYTQKRCKSQYIDEGMRDTNAIFRGRERDEAIENYSKQGKFNNAKEISGKKIMEVKNKNDKIKKLRKIFATVLVGTTLLASGIQAISSARAEETNYNNTSISVSQEGLNEQQLSDRIIEELKQKIGEATNVNPENVSFSVQIVSSIMKIIKVKAGEYEFKYYYDQRGIKSGNMSGKIADLIGDANKGEDMKEKIKILSNVKNINITFDNGKLIDKDQNER